MVLTTGTLSMFMHAFYRDLLRKRSIIKIENCWLSFCNRRIFRLLKHSVRAAERSLSEEIIKRVCPRELELLKDKCVHMKVKFRFGGEVFPPVVYFKIYQCRADVLGGRTYVSGKVIHKNPSASRAACDMMGNRKYIEMMTRDALQQHNNSSSNSDISNLRNYVKNCSIVDELPAYLGGRSNSWRKLTLEDLPRHVVFYDVIDYAYNHQMTSVLHNNLSLLARRPCDETLLLEQLKLVSQSNRSGTSSVASHYRRKPAQMRPGCSSRRSAEAFKRAEKMKAAYDIRLENNWPMVSEASSYSTNELSVNNVATNGKIVNSSTTNRKTDNISSTNGKTDNNTVANGKTDNKAATNRKIDNKDVGGVCEKEVEFLYEWTQSLDDDALLTSRLF